MAQKKIHVKHPNFVCSALNKYYLKFLKITTIDSLKIKIRKWKPDFTRGLSKKYLKHTGFFRKLDF